MRTECETCLDCPGQRHHDAAESFRPQDDGTACDESGTVATASSVPGWCLVVVIGLVIVAAVARRLLS